MRRLECRCGLIIEQSRLATEQSSQSPQLLGGIRTSICSFQGTDLDGDLTCVRRVSGIFILTHPSEIAIGSFLYGAHGSNGYIYA